jgi:hypothetical protein
MNHYTINGRDYVVINNELYQKIPLKMVIANEPPGDKVPPARRPIPADDDNKPRGYGKQTKRRSCSVCKKPGHTAKTCPKNRASNYGYSDNEESETKKTSGLDEATIQRIKELYTDGKSMKEIREATGVSLPTIASIPPHCARSANSGSRKMPTMV